MRPKKGRIPESVVENYLVDQVENIGGLCVKGNPHNRRGFPDRIAILPNGVVLFIEVKRPGYKPRANQRKTLQRLVTLGHHAVWVNSKGMIDRLITWMVKMINTTKVVGDDYVCNRPNCRARVTEEWKDYISRQSTSSFY
jgi:hypothetical protein